MSKFKKHFKEQNKLIIKANYDLANNLWHSFLDELYDKESITEKQYNREKEKKL